MIEGLHRLSEEDREEIEQLYRTVERQAEQIGKITAASADLHSRLDELRRVFNPVSGTLFPTVYHVGSPGAGPSTRRPPWPPGTIWRGRDIGETASGCLAEHSGLSDPEGGG